MEELNGVNIDGESDNSKESQEETLVALINHRTNEVQHLRRRISYYTSQLEEAEKRLQDTECQLARLRGQTHLVSSRSCLGDITKTVKTERRSTSPIHRNESSSKIQHKHKPLLVIPSVTPQSSQSQHILLPTSEGASISTGLQACPSLTTHSITSAKVKSEKSCRTSSEDKLIEVKGKHKKRKMEQNEPKELIPLIGTSSSPCLVGYQSSNQIASQHKRKLRSLALCPVNDKHFATSALDGVVNLWNVQSRGSEVPLLSTTDCASQKNRRWPEDIAWHPDGNSLFLVYSADGGDSQVSVMNLNKKKAKNCVRFLEDKPHLKGINSIVFMPWEETCFVTGGTDHAVILWSEDSRNIWKPKELHRNLHSSAVMGTAGMQQKQIVLSAGADKRILAYDTQVEKEDFRHLIDSKCMSILPNPCDFNLFMVQTGTHEKQLRLFDVRLKTEVHAFGWKQESSESQSALINQAWSPDGLYITSGSMDPIIHIFDIRYNSHKPSQSVRAHQKRVFKAVWLKSEPLLISISSDLNIGLHKIV